MVFSFLFEILFCINVFNKIRNIIIYKTPLHLAVENDNIEIVKMLLSHPQINVNLTAIFFYHFSFF